MADLVILASGSGSNFEAIVHATRDAGHRVLALLCDNADAYALVRAARLRVPAEVLDYAGGRRAAETALLDRLVQLHPDLIVLAGFMRILPPEIVGRFPGAIVNVHPSLLPDTPGLDAIERTFAAGGPMGVTVHLVDEGVDTGTVLAQEEVPRPARATLEEMEAAIHQVEHRLYPKAVLARLAKRIGVAS